jgi:NAD(P)-dependent dehydrogenase (short-subunit alcohol dehydrogenase family)
MQLTGASALVTGAASGLGAATAAALVSKGMTVVGLDLAGGWERSPAPEGVVPVSGDVRDEATVEQAVQAVRDTGKPLRLTVSCAGVADPGRIVSRKGPAPLAGFEKVVSINLIGTFNVLRVAAGLMAEQEPVDEQGQRGLLVTTASVAAFDGQVGQAAYAASKGGVAAMTLPLARDLAQSGIRVMCIAPGILDTPMMAGITEEFREQLINLVPFPHRLGTPAEYADLVCKLADLDYLNGETIRLDGSLRMPPR